MDENKKRPGHCGPAEGTLPPCAPLSVGIVPAQAGTPRYKPKKALSRGTLFSALDMPLAGIANGESGETPLTRLMALDFACLDLSLYLDTHPEDTEAFAVYQELLRRADREQREYVQEYGPLEQRDMAEAKAYTWPEGRWPWVPEDDGEA